MFWTRVQDRMDEVGISSIRELEQKAGVSNGTISVRKNQLKLPTVTIAEGLCHALRWSWVELWAYAGYVPPGTLDTHVALEEQELISHYRHLSPDRQEILLDVTRGLRQGMTGHYTFVPAPGFEDNQLTAEVYCEILELEDAGQFHEAIIKLLSNANVEQQKAMLAKLRERWRKRAEQEQGAEINQGGRALS